MAKCMSATGMSSMTGSSKSSRDHGDSTEYYDIGSDSQLRPGRPLRTVPVICPSSISEGEHILYLINSSADYRPVYRSALVESISQDGNITMIIYTPQGVQRNVQQFHSFKSLHRVDYTISACTGRAAVEKAGRRVGECYYHGLFNNSHHFVSWTKTGLEYSLADLVHGVQEPWKDDYELKPVLMRASIDSIENVEPGDHIMDCSNHHWLVDSLDVAKSAFSGFTCNGKTVTLKEVQWRDKFFKVEYPHCNVDSSTILQQARGELDSGTKWDGSDRFITKMKWGKSFAINEASLIDSNKCAPVSCTKVTPYMVLDQGDHLIVKSDGKYCSVLVEAIIDANTIVCMPDIYGLEAHGDLMVSEKEAYRVNYGQHLPPDEVLARAESSEGQQMLQSCLHDSSLFVTWAITGKQMSVKAEELIKKQELKMVRPICYKRITSETCNEIQPGDHLFVHYTARYRWHFMVTEVCAEPHVYKTVYFLRGIIKETVETVDPSRLNLYKVMYAEEFVPDVAIRRARSRVGEKKVDLWARVEFVRWAKTGSDEGVEIDLMTNVSAPTSKSSIVCFQQLNPGDYLIVEEDKFTRYHHCLVLDVSSPTSCMAMEVWNRKVRHTCINLNLSKHTYYRLNYDTNSGVCRPAKESVNLARETMKGSSFPSKHSRQKFVNFLKTGDDSQTVDVNSLQDDRILLPREKVESAKQLKRGDHIERPLQKIGGLIGYFHHMLVLHPVDDRLCEVIHCDTGHHGVTGSSIRRETVDIFETGKVSRVKYTERIDPEEGIAQLLKLAGSDSQLGQASNMKRDYSLFRNNCEHVVMIGTIGTAVSIQVDIHMYQDLHERVHAMSPGLGDACVRATSNGAMKTVMKLASTAIVRGGARAAARGGGTIFTQGAADAAETGLSTAVANSFRVGYTAALTATTVGLVSGIALGANLIIESPLLVRSIYKIHRKRKFDVISSTEAKRQIAVQSFTSVNTVIGGTAGAIVGQVAIPVPVLGAVVGGFAGIIAGKGLGNLEGRGVALLISDKETDLPVIVHCFFVSMDN